MPPAPGAARPAPTLRATQGLTDNLDESARVVREQKRGGDDGAEVCRESFCVGPGESGDGSDLDVERGLRGVLLCGTDFDGTRDGC